MFETSAVEISSFRELDCFEIEEVSGGVFNMGAGALIGAGAYLLYAGVSGEFSWGGLAGATVAGAITSGLSAAGVGAGWAAAGGAFQGGLTDALIER